MSQLPQQIPTKLAGGSVQQLIPSRFIAAAGISTRNYCVLGISSVSFSLFTQKYFGLNFCLT
jgi:hypothetical protein